jgi:hypothetical protein
VAAQQALVLQTKATQVVLALMVQIILALVAVVLVKLAVMLRLVLVALVVWASHHRLLLAMVHTALAAAVVVGDQLLGPEQLAAMVEVAPEVETLLVLLVLLILAVEVAAQEATFLVGLVVQVAQEL